MKKARMIIDILMVALLTIKTDVGEVGSAFLWRKMSIYKFSCLTFGNTKYIIML